MYSKKDYITALNKLGFVKDETTKTSGSHFRYYHDEYRNVFAGIDDHKNTKDMSKNIHQELIKTMLLVVWLKSRNTDGTVNFNKAEEVVSGINNSMAAELIQRLTNLNERSSSLLLAIIPRRLASEVSKVKKNMTDETILDYLIN